MNAFRELLEVLVQNRTTTLTELGETTGVSRAAWSDIRNGKTQNPHRNTMLSLEKATRMPPGTIDQLLAGELTPEEAASRVGRPQQPDTESAVSYRLLNLEASVGRLRDDLRSFQDETDSVERRLALIEDEARSLQELRKELQAERTARSVQLERLESLLQQIEGR